jgi:hypothetical protein
MSQVSKNDDTKEMCDRIRNRGTLVDMVIISREDLEALIQKRVDDALKGVRDAISNITR